ncbi:MAG: radical SAM/Cys-rich domain protein [Planctomycetota bacterium]|nr:MAG: radical SAM/Cys-rich domain protein [Planctomycetota bacterium]
MKTKAHSKTFDDYLKESGNFPLSAEDIQVIQVNIGLKCNLQCHHCHVASGPWRKEEMSWKTMEYIIQAAKSLDPLPLVDITGGAPELNPHIKPFIQSLRKEGIPVQVRTNLTVHLLPEMKGMAEFFMENEVALVASLPCYLEENVDQQRGSGVFKESIEVLQFLNFLGYGINPRLTLALVYNPIGPKLPPCQEDLEKAYKAYLESHFSIRFTKLYTITNMPIGRFWGDLKKAGMAKKYEALLQESFNPSTVPHLMCRHQITVGWDGTLYDCDFHYASKLPISSGSSLNIRDFDKATLSRRKICTVPYCFGCTAGFGSSCGGSLANE